MNPRECVWEIRHRIIIKTTLQEKERIHCSTTILVHKFIPMPQVVKIPAAKAAVEFDSTAARWDSLIELHGRAPVT